MRGRLTTNVDQAKHAAPRDRDARQTAVERAKANVALSLGNELQFSNTVVSDPNGATKFGFPECSGRGRAGSRFCIARDSSTATDIPMIASTTARRACSFDVRA